MATMAAEPALGTSRYFDTLGDSSEADKIKGSSADDPAVVAQVKGSSEDEIMSSSDDDESSKLGIMLSNATITDKPLNASTMTKSELELLLNRSIADEQVPSRKACQQYREPRMCQQ